MITRSRSILPSDLKRMSSSFLLPLALLILVFAMRWPFLGHPALHVDEQFYLLAGERIRHGWLPYLDLWDRKPVGLFLIYAAIRLAGGDGVVPYQLTATVFAAATSYAIFLIARRSVTDPPAFASAVLYVALLAPLNGAGGQAPVFYNLFMAVSALLVLRAGEAPDRRMFLRNGATAMVCAGLALQIKYIAVIEGALFGLWLMASGQRWTPNAFATLKIAGMFAFVALLPTLMVLAWFAAHGDVQAFIQANFVSIFQRGSAAPALERDALVHTIRMVGFAFVLAGVALGLRWLRRPRQDRLFLTFWFAFALAGFLAIGNYYDHYALPLLVPLTLLLSRLFAVRFVGPAAFGLVALQATLFGLYRYSPTSEGKAVVAAMTARIAPIAAKGHCLFVADTPLILYLTTGACGPWRYSFPFHLLDGTEAGTGDVDQPGAMRAILAARPGAIVTGSPQFTPTLQEANAALLRRTLAADYSATGRYADRGRTYTVWIRRDLASLRYRPPPASGTRAPA